MNSIEIKFDDKYQALKIPLIGGLFGKSKLNFLDVVGMIMTKEIRSSEVGFPVQD